MKLKQLIDDIRTIRLLRSMPERIYDSGLDWLENRFKSLRPQPKEQDVEKNPEDKSFEDEWKDYYNNSLVSRRPLNKREVAKHFYWFAKKNDWKPSKEQMEALKSTMYDYKDVPWYNQLVSLYNNLEKL